jgi:hypothetical protein
MQIFIVHPVIPYSTTSHEPFLCTKYITGLAIDYSQNMAPSNIVKWETKIGELSVKIYSSSTSLTLTPTTVNQSDTATLAGHAELLTIEDDVAFDQEDHDDEHDLDFAIDPSNNHINGVVDAIGDPERRTKE